MERETRCGTVPGGAACTTSHGVSTGHAGSLRIRYPPVRPLDVVAAGPFDHVAGQGPGAAREADQGHAAVQSLADGRDRVEDVAQLVHVGHGQLGDCRFVADHALELRALALLKREAQAHGIGHGEDVAEQDGRVERVALERLQRDLGGVVGIGGQAHEAAGLGARGAVLRQVAAGLAHQPEGRVVSGLAQAGAQEVVVLERGKHRRIILGCTSAGPDPGHAGRRWRRSVSRPIRGSATGDPPRSRRPAVRPGCQCTPPQRTACGASRRPACRPAWRSARGQGSRPPRRQSPGW